MKYTRSILVHVYILSCFVFIVRDTINKIKPTVSYAGGSYIQEINTTVYNETITNISVHRKVDSNLLEASKRFVRYLIQCMTL